MIVVSRKTGECIYADPLSEQQQKDAAFLVFQAFCQMNPDVIRKAVEEYQREARNENT